MVEIAAQAPSGSLNPHPILRVASDGLGKMLSAHCVR